MFLRSSEAFLFGLIFAATMVYMVGVGLDSLQLVLVGTALESAVFLFEIPTGVVADYRSRRLSIVIGFLITGAAYLLMGTVPRFVAIATASALWGLGYTFTSGAVDAWIVDEIGQDAAEPLFPKAGKISALTGVAGTLSGMGLGAIRIELPIVVGGILFLILAAVLAAVMPEFGFEGRGRREAQSERRRGPFAGLRRTTRSGVAVVRGAPLLIGLIFAELLFGAHSEGFDRLRDAHLIREIGVPPPFPPVVWLGAVAIGTGLLVSLGNSLTERSIRRLDRPGVPLAALTIVAAGAIVAFAASQAFAPAVGLIVVVGITRGIAGPILSIWLNRNIPSRVRATVLSMWGQADAAGQILLGPVVGLIGRGVGIRWALVVSAAVLLPTFSVYVWAAVRNPSR